MPEVANTILIIHFNLLSTIKLKAMKNTIKLLLIAFIIPAFVFTSCKDEPTEEVVEFDVLKSHLVAEGMDLDHIIKNADGAKFVAAPPTDDPETVDVNEVDVFIAKYYIVDIRSAEDFALGHIEGAKNISFSSILTDAANAGDKPILVVCYTGQTACYATSLLRLYGYQSTQALKWGMSGWNADFAAKWNSTIASNIASGNANWTSEAAPANNVYSNPVLNTGKTSGSEILKAQVEAVVAAGFKTVNAPDVLETPGTYHINNFFSEAHYTGFGHIKGAYRINPVMLTDDTYNALDPEGKVVTYCYTGQTSAVITAFYNVMGYEAYSMLFGMNKLWNENPFWADPEIKNQWGADSNPKELPVVQ